MRGWCHGLIVLVIAGCAEKSEEEDLSSASCDAGTDNVVLHEPDCSQAQCTFIHTEYETGCFISKRGLDGKPKGASECDYLFDQLCVNQGVVSYTTCQKLHITR